MYKKKYLSLIFTTWTTEVCVIVLFKIHLEVINNIYNFSKIAT